MKKNLYCLQLPFALGAFPGSMLGFTSGLGFVSERQIKQKSSKFLPE